MAVVEKQNENILEMRKIDKIFPGVKALDQVDFSLDFATMVK